MRWWCWKTICIVTLPLPALNAALAKAPLVMVVDHQRTAIMENAHLVLSAASFAESDGTVVNNEGRAQRFFQVYDPAYYDSENRDAGKLALAALIAQHPVNNRQVDWTQLDHVIDAAVADAPAAGRYQRRRAGCDLPHSRAEAGP